MRIKFHIFFALLFLAGISKAQVQNCLDFDGVDDNITVPGASALINGMNQLSISCWVYPSNTNFTYPNYDGYMGFRNNTNADFYIVQLSPTGIEARFRNSTGTNYDIVYSGVITDTWQHFVFTYDGDNLTLYHNDVQVGTTAATGSITNISSPLWIGNLPYSADNFYLFGKIDEVSLWSKALNASEIHCMYLSGINPVASNLLLYYNFNQGQAGANNTGLSTLTATAGTLDGTLNNFMLFSSTSNWVEGVTGSTFANATICSGQAYTFGTQTLTTAGTYTEVFSTPSGCDSTVTLTLTVNSFDLSLTQTGVTLTAAQAGGTYQWLNCGTGYSAIGGATSQSYTATANGTYAARISYNGCTDTTVCHAITTVGIDGPGSEPQWQVYPVPFQDKLSVDLGAVYDNVTVSVAELCGRVVFMKSYGSAQHTECNLGSASSGLYFIDIQCGTRHFRSKVVKQ